jgi:molybdopterin converting factor subunit 1
LKCTGWAAEYVQISVRYFAAFREATGVASEQVDSGAKTPAALFAECTVNHPALAAYSASLVAINDEMADWERPLTEGDEVLFFPPVAGG